MTLILFTVHVAVEREHPARQHAEAHTITGQMGLEPAPWRLSDLQQTSPFLRHTSGRFLPGWYETNKQGCITVPENSRSSISSGYFHTGQQVFQGKKSTAANGAGYETNHNKDDKHSQHSATSLSYFQYSIFLSDFILSKNYFCMVEFVPWSKTKQKKTTQIIQHMWDVSTYHT